MDKDRSSERISFFDQLKSAATLAYKKTATAVRTIQTKINPPPPPDINTAEDDAKIARSYLDDCWEGYVHKKFGISTDKISSAAKYIERARSKDTKIEVPYIDVNKNNALRHSTQWPLKLFSSKLNFICVISGVFPSESSLYISLSRETLS